eukprot:6203599-Pleurochrysis_carterae.AAC.4
MLRRTGTSRGIGSHGSSADGRVRKFAGPEVPKAMHARCADLGETVEMHSVCMIPNSNGRPCDGEGVLTND